MGLRTVITPVRGQSTRANPLGDGWLVALTAFLLAFGLVMLYSASWDISYLKNDPPTAIFLRQLLWAALGTVVMLIASRLDYHLWEKWALPTILLTLFLLLAVLFFGEMRYDARRTLWGGSIQPSELAKLVTVIYLSVWLYAKREVLNTMAFGLLPMSVILGLVGGLILLQPDLSAVLSIFMLGVALYLLAVSDLKLAFLWLFIAILTGAAIVLISGRGTQRLVDYWTGLQDPASASYHVVHAMDAVAHGGVFGVGLGLGQEKLTGLPVPHTDSIFAVIVEELGLVGGLLVWLGFLAFLWRGIQIASRAPDMLGALLASGISFWIVGEAILNMGVIVGALPFAGNALPFFSAGGSSLLTTMAGVGILLNIARQGKANPSFWRYSGATARVRGRNGRGRVSSPGRSANLEE